MEEVLLDRSAEYGQMLDRGIRLSGESQEFFVNGRVASLRSRLPAEFRPRRVLDFGCGIGGAARRLAETFAGAEIVGVDTSQNALEYGAEHYGSGQVSFRPIEDLPNLGEF